jgi:hypothetical protein
MSNLRRVATKVETETLEITEVLNCFIEAVEVGSKLANSSDVVELMIKEMLPFTESWQRRSIGIIRDTVGLRRHLLSGLNRSGQAILDLKKDIDDAFQKLKRESQQIESSLYFGILNANKVNHQLRSMKKDAKKIILVKVLLWMSVFEVAVISAFFGWQGAKSLLRKS